tara:strand:+ start:364 stop:750 length:387 start_codon:yes stop_codon:yes gene_type:complete
MKNKITLLVLERDVGFDFNSDDFCKVLVVDDQNNFPNKYICKKNVEDTLADLVNQYLNVTYEWMNISLEAFRRNSVNECEAVYCAVVPKIIDCNKDTAFFKPTNNLQGIENFYGEIIARRRPYTGGQW